MKISKFVEHSDGWKRHSACTHAEGNSSEKDWKGDDSEVDAGMWHHPSKGT